MPELMIVIVLMGIVLAIASCTWIRVVESRQVDSATNQMVSDLGLAHTRATNRLVSYEVSLIAGNSTYNIGFELGSRLSNKLHLSARHHPVSSQRAMWA